MPIHQQEAVADVEDVLPLVQAVAMEDRDVLEKGTRAFVSFIRGYVIPMVVIGECRLADRPRRHARTYSYKEHKCRFIFRYSALDVGAVARAFALLKLPRMSEFRGAKVRRRWPRKLRS